jgi:hypothetical protein
MAEAPDGRIVIAQTIDGAEPTSTAAMKAAIRETRGRLAARFTRTADHVHVLFTAPAFAGKEASNGDVLGAAVTTIAVAGRARRAWSDVRNTGLLRRGAIGGVTLAVAAVLAIRAARR